MIAVHGVDKPALRDALRKRRRSFLAAFADRAEAERRIAALADAELGRAAVVALYRPCGGEVGTDPLLALLGARGLSVALPFSADRQAIPEFRRWPHDDPLEDGPFGVLQPLARSAPITPAAIVTPLLAFDRSRHRLGQGAGWYDRAFARWPEARRIGLAWSVQEIDAVPRDPWDVPLHAIVTEEGVL